MADPYLERWRALQHIQGAIDHLHEARDLLRQAGAARACDKVRRALKSAEGAERHGARMKAEAKARAIAEVTEPRAGWLRRIGARSTPAGREARL